MTNNYDEINIAIACEITPAKTLIPIIHKLKELEENNLLNWDKTNIIALTHGLGANEIIAPYVNQTYPIGQGRKAGNIKRNNFELIYLIIKDIIKAIKSLKGKNIDLLISCGNAGDVRKSIIAASLLKIPILHIEQDIYNPIEAIAYANIITLPSNEYKEYFKNIYHFDKGIKKNLININGYPMATYVNQYIQEKKLIPKEKILLKYGINDFIFLVLGGDIKQTQIKKLIKIMEKSPIPVLIAPFRFKKEFIKNLVSSNNIKVLDEFVDILSLMNSSKLTIFGAGMGMTIEAGVIPTSSIKIKGFHKQQGSIDLAESLDIPIVEINDLPKILSNFNNINNCESSKRKDLLNFSNIAIKNVVNIINNFNFNNPPKKSGIKSLIAIWNKRKKFK